MNPPLTVSTKHNKYLATGTSAVEAVITVRAEAGEPAESADWSDVRLRIWIQAGAQVTGLRQLIPDSRDLQGARREVGTGTWEHPLGTFAAGEERTFHLRLVDVGEHRETAGLPHAVGRVSVHLGSNGTATDEPGASTDATTGDRTGRPAVDLPVARSTIEAVWSDDPDAMAERDADFGDGTMQQFMAGALADAREAQARAAEQGSGAAEAAGASGTDRAPDADAAPGVSQASDTGEPAADTSGTGEDAGPATVEFPPGSDTSETRPEAPPTSPPAPKKSGKGRPRRPAAPTAPSEDPSFRPAPAPEDPTGRTAPGTEEPSAGSEVAVSAPAHQPSERPAGGARGRPRRRPD